MWGLTVLLAPLFFRLNPCVLQRESGWPVPTWRFLDRAGKEGRRDAMDRRWIDTAIGTLSSHEQRTAVVPRRARAAVDPGGPGAT